MIEKTLDELALNITDGKHGDCEGEEGSGFYFISCKDVRDGMIHYEEARQITEHDFVDANRRTMLAPNDILITNSGTIGRMALVRDTSVTYRTTFQKSVAIVKPNAERVLPKYLYYQLQNCVEGFINQSNGSAQKNLLLSTMRAFKLKIHESKDEQRRIADILSAYDDLIENNRKQIKLLEEAAQRLYKEWFVDLRFPGHEHTAVVDGVPEGWKIKALSQVAQLKAGGDKPKVFSKIKTTQCNIPVYSNGIDDAGLYGYTDVAEIVDECITISARGSVGYTCFRRKPFVPIVRLISIVPVDVDVIWLYFYLKNTTFDSNGVAQQQITVPMINDKPILIPSKSVMEQFACKVRCVMDLLDAKISCGERLIESRDRLLPKLMNGEIEV